MIVQDRELESAYGYDSTFSPDLPSVMVGTREEQHPFPPAQAGQAREPYRDYHTSFVEELATRSTHAWIPVTAWQVADYQTADQGYESPADSGVYEYIASWVPYPTQQIGTRTILRPVSRWFSYVNMRLHQMAEHQLTSHAYPDAPIIQRAWSEAVSLFPLSAPTPSVVPSDEGGVAYVWHKRGWDLEIDVRQDGAMVWARNRNLSNEETWYGSLDDYRERVFKLLRDLSKA
jgi:hypothetical protein